MRYAALTGTFNHTNKALMHFLIEANKGDLLLNQNDEQKSMPLSISVGKMITEDEHTKEVFWYLKYTRKGTATHIQIKHFSTANPIFSFYVLHFLLQTYKNIITFHLI